MKNGIQWFLWISLIVIMGPILSLLGKTADFVKVAGFLTGYDAMAILLVFIVMDIKNSYIKSFLLGSLIFIIGAVIVLFREIMNPSYIVIALIIYNILAMLLAFIYRKKLLDSRFAKE